MNVKKKSAKDDQVADDGTDAGKKVATLLGKKMPYSWDIHLIKSKNFSCTYFFS